MNAATKLILSSTFHSEPTQLELFASASVAADGPRPAPVTLEDGDAAVDVMMRALESGKTVGLLKSHEGFELLISAHDVLPGTDEIIGTSHRLGERCGFSRRPAELLVRGVCEYGRRLWARPAGSHWTGWVEWGHLVGAASTGQRGEL
jgi:hypothetical protein